LVGVSPETPVLLVLDDLQWAAKPTLLLLRHVLRSPEPLRLLVVATHRDTDIGRGHPLAELLADVPRLGCAECLPLSGLDTAAVAAYLELAAGKELDEDRAELARAVWRETEGNAFFVAEVLRHLAESGAIARRDGRCVLGGRIEELGIPQGVRDVVGRRLSRLSEDANRVLGCAAHPRAALIRRHLAERFSIESGTSEWEQRLAEVAAPPLPTRDTGHGLDLGL
jgi:predicted ATPase